VRESAPEPEAADGETPSRRVPISDAHELSPVLAALRRSSLFSGLSDAELKLLANSAKLLNYAKNNYVFRAGDPGCSWSCPA
jgi:hypothetical protein